MKHILYLALFALMIVSNSCSKEFSEEEGSGDQSSGSLVSETTGECLPKTVNGAYIAGTTLGASDFIEVDVDVVTEGRYTIITDTINGYYFAGSGEFTSTGINTVKLFGKGKPLAEGSDFFIVSYDTTFCEVEVQVLPTGTQPPPPPPATGTYFWKFTVSGITYQGTIDINDASLQDTTIGGYNFKAFYFEASDAADDNFMSLTLADLAGGINANENYTSPPMPTNNAVHFDWIDEAGNYYETSATTFTAKVTAHNTSTKVIEGTFNGTAKNIMSGATRTVSGGQFKVNYP
jgi:hypothetical protein